LLIKCKQHGGPITSLEELKRIENNKPFLRLELQFQRLTHAIDTSYRPELYKVNRLTAEQMSANLKILINPDNHEASSTVTFFNQEEVLEILKSEVSDLYPAKKIYFQQLVAVMWDEQQSKQWYIGFMISESEDSLIVDHLERKGNNTNWQRPKVDDTQSVDMTQIVPCLVEGD